LDHQRRHATRTGLENRDPEAFPSRREHEKASAAKPLQHGLVTGGRFETNPVGDPELASPRDQPILLWTAADDQPGYARKQCQGSEHDVHVLMRQEAANEDAIEGFGSPTLPSPRGGGN